MRIGDGMNMDERTLLRARFTGEDRCLRTTLGQPKDIFSNRAKFVI